MADRPTVGVRELRQNLSVYLRRVRNGETLEVTERGNPVAILTPLPERAATMARLVAEGRLTPASRDLSELGPPVRVELEKPLSVLLDELREDRI
jgi:prevent-host-death family protein